MKYLRMGISSLTSPMMKHGYQQTDPGADHHEVNKSVTSADDHPLHTTGALGVVVNQIPRTSGSKRD
ncbi:hypothetical protein R1flu_017937 [Riccia fluitans]|uniref:Uncharacterized protein n=1 Tax=Riccia fluitans TaxID=41844 RepID=A0ABD1ZHS9_9MARC